ncbi:hypothetical protein QQ054_32115 [Oscillatoria amoena NRMC-F 0135]|nr:hypothetical protein [Oscillatoria amoena NRMC-F 0135]
MLFKPAIQAAKTSPAEIKTPRKEIAKHIPFDTLDVGVQCHFWNGGKVNLHDVLERVLLQTGPSRIYLSTWSMGAPSVKKLLSMKNKGLIIEISAVVDLRTRKDHAEAYNMAVSFFDRLAINKCHAKVIAICDGKFPATILGSANLTRNTKHERICISTTPGVVEGDITAINELIANGQTVK